MSELRGIIVALLLGASSARAQTADAWRQRLDSSRVLSLRADSAYVRAREEIMGVKTGRVIGGGRTIRYDVSAVSASDITRITAGLEMGRAQLVERFGHKETSR